MCERPKPRALKEPRQEPEQQRGYTALNMESEKCNASHIFRKKRRGTHRKQRRASDGEENGGRTRVLMGGAERMSAVPRCAYFGFVALGPITMFYPFSSFSDIYFCRC
jgi:hypothetical protein